MRKSKSELVRSVASTGNLKRPWVGKELENLSLENSVAGEVSSSWIWQFGEGARRMRKIKFLGREKGKKVVKNCLLLLYYCFLFRTIFWFLYSWKSQHVVPCFYLQRYAHVSICTEKFSLRLTLTILDLISIGAIGDESKGNFILQH